MARVVASPVLLALPCICTLLAAACSFSAPTLDEYSSAWVVSRSGSAGSSGWDAASSASSSLGQGGAGTPAAAGAGGTQANGGAWDELGAAGDTAIAGASAAAGASGTAGMSGIAATSGTAGALGTAGETGTAGASGTAGAGGNASTLSCSDGPLTRKSTWLASASSQDDAPPSVVLDNTASRWTTGKAQAGDEWLQIDFGAAVTIRRINLQQGEYTNDYPRSYAVYVSNTNHGAGSSVRASGVGSNGVTTTIVLPKPYSGRYLYIKQLGTSLSWWSVEELEVSCYDD